MSSKQVFDSATLPRIASNLADDFASTANAHDAAGTFPADEFRHIAESGLLRAPLPVKHGGFALGLASGSTLALLNVLREFGRGNLAIGRVYEGHVNALQLVRLFGTRRQLDACAADVRAGKIFGVWNTESRDGVVIEQIGDDRFRLAGSKTFASGSTNVTRPIVTGRLLNARGADAGWQMCIVPLDEVAVGVDESWWQPLGMRASVSHKIDFSGVELTPDDLVGAPNDYYLQPWFGAGAIRFSAVQLGGAEALFDLTRDYLRLLARDGDPFQRSRAGECAILIESGRHWLRHAAELADACSMTLSGSDDEHANEVRAGDERTTQMLAYANMMRTHIESICLDVMRLAERSIGARGLLRPHPMERIHRDLTLYLRQPGTDAALAAAGRHALESARPAARLWTHEEDDLR